MSQQPTAKELAMMKAVCEFMGAVLPEGSNFLTIVLTKDGKARVASSLDPDGMKFAAQSLITFLNEGSSGFQIEVDVPG